MELICKIDYDLRVLATIKADKEKKRLKEVADEAARQKRRAEERGGKKKKKFRDPVETPAEESEPEREIAVPRVGFHDLYGVWFFGPLADIIRQVARERFDYELHHMLHVYVDVKPWHPGNDRVVVGPPSLDEGIYDVTVYGHTCHLHLWLAQGYYRGLVVLADDIIGNDMAQIYMNSRTWSWVVSADYKRRLAAVDVVGIEIYRLCTLL